MDFLEYKGYKGSVEYSKEDNCLFGKVQGLSKDLIAWAEKGGGIVKHGVCKLTGDGSDWAGDTSQRPTSL